MDVQLTRRGLRARAGAAGLALVLAAVSWPSPAAADTEAELSHGLTRIATGSSAPGSTNPETKGGQTTPPEGELTLTADQAIRIARQDPKVIAEEQSRGRLEAVTQANPPDTWQVGFRDGGTEVAQVLVDDATGTVRESWTGYQVAWQMARGYEGSFGHKLNAPYVWIPLCLIFFLGLLDWRKPLRMVHLDLLVLLGFSASQFFFNRADIGVSVPLVYPVLAYLLVRGLWIGFRGTGLGLRPTVPVTWLATAAVFLLAFRVAINIADSGVIDVGYAGTIGADRIMHGETVWGLGQFPSDNPFGDTYGPVAYFAYVPFELALPWHGTWDNLPSSHGAAIFFDLASVAGLFFLGRRLRKEDAGNALGVVLAFAWLAYPYTDYALQANSNDSLVAALLVWSLVAFAWPLLRGLLLAAATLTKFAPLALLPLYAAGTTGLAAGLPGRLRVQGLLGRKWLRTAALFFLAFAVASAVFLALPAVKPGLATFYHRAISSQVNRTSPFSIWGQTDLEWLQKAVRYAVVVLGLSLAFIPRRRSLPQIGALAAAVIIAIQLTADHWFYLYIVWFFPLLLAGMVAAEPQGTEPAEGTRALKEPATVG